MVPRLYAFLISIGRGTWPKRFSRGLEMTNASYLFQSRITSLGDTRGVLYGLCIYVKYLLDYLGTMLLGRFWFGLGIDGCLLQCNSPLATRRENERGLHGRDFS
jgi:hypothetical protein